MKKYLAILFVFFLACGCVSSDFQRASLNGNLKQEMYEQAKTSKIKTVELLPIQLEDDGLEEIIGEIDIELKEPVAISEFLSLVSKIKQIPIIADFRDEKVKTKIDVSCYKGDLKNLLENIANTYGVFFKYKKGILTASNKNYSHIGVDRYPEIGKILESVFKTFNAEQVTYDPVASRVSFLSDYKAYKKIKSYVQELNKSLSLLTLHVIVGEVELSNTSRVGIDWENISLSYISPRSRSTATDATTEQASQVLRSGTLSIQQGITTFNLNLANFSMTSVINALEKYGKFRIIQNTYITVLNGTRGKIDASSKFPYVKEIGVSTIGTGTAGTTTAQTVSFDEATSGVIIDVTPNYDATKNLLHILISGRVENVISFVEVSTGTSGTKVSRPIRSVRNIDTQAVIDPESVLILGGLISTHNNNATTGLPLLSSVPLFGIRSSESKATELVIIIQPELTRFVYAQK